MASNSQPLLLSGGGLAFNEIKSITGILKIAQVEPIYHILAAILYLCGGIGLMAVVRELLKSFPYLFTAGLLGTVAGILHTIHGNYSWKDWQAQKYQSMQIPQAGQPTSYGATGQTSYIPAQPVPAVGVQASYPTLQAPNQPQYQQ